MESINDDGNMKERMKRWNEIIHTQKKKGFQKVCGALERRMSLLILQQSTRKRHRASIFYEMRKGIIYIVTFHMKSPLCMVSSNPNQMINLARALSSIEFQQRTM